MNIKNEPINCPRCTRQGKHRLEDRNHVLWTCWKDTHQYRALVRKLPTTKLKIIFTNKKTQEALMEFLESTGAFTKNREVLSLWPEPCLPPEPPPEWGEMDTPKTSSKSQGTCVSNDTAPGRHSNQQHCFFAITWNSNNDPITSLSK